MSIRDLTYFFLWSSACVIRSIADCFSSFIRPSTRHGQLLYHCSYFIYSQLLKMGLSSARTHPLQTDPQFWPPSPNTQPLQFRSLPKIELLFPFSLPFCKTSTPFFSVLCVPQCIPTHTHTHSRSAFPHHFNWIFSFPFLLPFWTNDLFCHEVGYFCCLSLPLFLYFHTFLLSVRWIMEKSSHRYHFRLFSFWLHGWTDWWINTWEV